MPPGRRSSSSHSSRSRSSSSSRRSSSSHRRRTYGHHSSSSHSSSFNSVPVGRPRYNQPKNIPTNIRKEAVTIRCQNHDYVYYKSDWVDEITGTYYKQGYYDENGRYYDAQQIAFKQRDGSYTAHYHCEYCDSDLEQTWHEGFNPKCQNCGAEMSRQPVFVDNITDTSASNASSKPAKLLFGFLALFWLAPFIIILLIFVVVTIFINSVEDNPNWVEVESGHYEYIDVDETENIETNLDIYGTDLYLDEVGYNTYVVCNESDDYEKHLTWDYGSGSYYDYDSDCYIWYNTDVVPNIWQYWYEDIAGDSYYGWMECEGTSWYIETGEYEWDYYDGDTSELWHIVNKFG